MPNQTVPQQIKELKSDVQELKSDVQELKSDVQELKSDVQEFKSEMTVFKENTENQLSSLKTTTDNLVVAVVELQVTVAAIKKEISTLMTKEDNNDILKILDMQTVFFKKMDQESTFQNHRTRELTDITDRHEIEIKELQMAVAG